MRRGILAVSVTTLIFGAAWGAEAQDEKEALREQIRQLQSQFVEARSRGEEATELRGALRDIREATKANDWGKVKDLITASRKQAGATAAPEAVEATTSTTGGVAAIPAERVAIASGDIAVSLLLWKPADTKKACPGVVLVADGFRGIGRVYRELGEFLAQKGYVVVAPELRGQGRSGGKVEFLGGEVDDVNAALTYLREQTFVDGDRIMLVGAGWGGSAALLATGKGAAVKGTAALAAPTDLKALLREAPGVRLRLRTMGVDVDAKDAKALKSKSPLYNATSFTGECFLVYGKADNSLPEGQTTRYAAVLKGRGVQVTVQPYVSMGRGFLEKKPEVYRNGLLGFLDKLSGLRKKAQPRGTTTRRAGGRRRN